MVKQKHLKNLVPYLILGFMSLCYYLVFINKGITLYDEGFIVESSYLTFLGKIPYKDFAFPYTPLSIWLGAMGFKIFGLGILKLRFTALLASLGTALLGYSIAKKVADKKVAILSALAIVIWGFPQTNFLWPSSLAVLPFFLTIFFVLRWLEENQNKLAVFAGISVALTILVKQNVGATLLITTLLILLLIKPQVFKKGIARFLAGVIITVLLAILILIFGNPHLTGFGELIFRSLRAAGGKILSSNLPSVNFWLNDMAGNLKSIAKFLLYYSPLFLTLGVLLLWAKKIKLNPAQVIVLLLSFTFFLTMVWPTIDLAHFTFGVPALVLAFTSVSKTSNKMVQRISSAYLLFFLLIGVYKTFFMSYYTFETPYLNLHKSVLIRNEKISVDDKHETVVNALNEYKNGIFKNKSVFVYSYAPMVYFILDKVPPVHDLYTQEGLISENSLQADVKSLGLSPPDFILIEKWRWVDSEITRFIKANYRPIASIWDFEVWQKI